MVNAQEWLDKNYPKENRNEVNIIKCDGIQYYYFPTGEIGRIELEGSLNLLDFINLEKLEINRHERQKERIINISIKNCPKLSYINVNQNGLENLEIVNCPKLEELYCSSNKLTKLDLSGFHKLNQLHARDNKLVSLDTSKNPNLDYFCCDDGLKPFSKLVEKGQIQEKRLNEKEAEISWLKDQLKKALGEDEYQAQIEVNYPKKWQANIII